MIDQLRIYEIFEDNKAIFHARFRDHAARIMRRHGFDIAAMWEARTAQRTEFIYLLRWPDEQARTTAWKNWADEQVLGVLIGDLADSLPAIGERVQGINEGLRETLPTLKFASLDTGGQSVRADALMTKFLRTERGRLLIATLDDLAAVYAKNAIEMNRRQSDCIIVSQGLDHNIHGGASEKKEIDPNNRGSVVLGSVAYYMDRYGYEVLPLALRMLNGETLPARTVTRHVLVAAANTASGPGPPSRAAIKAVTPPDPVVGQGPNPA
jgi:heme-degrading monooxygenase HmoA